MAAATLSQCSFNPLIHFSALTFYEPICFSNTDARLRISQTKAALPKLSHWLVVVSGLVDGNSETYPEAGSSDLNEEGAAIDIKLTRRSLLLQFTCSECGERSQRLINRLAYEQGLVFVQGIFSGVLFSSYSLLGKFAEP